MAAAATTRMLPDGALRKRKEQQVVPFVYAGAAIMSPSIFANAPKGEFSLTKMFDRANEQERLFGLRLDGVWMHVGTPDAVLRRKRRFWRAWRKLLSCPDAMRRSGSARRDPHLRLDQEHGGSQRVRRCAPYDT